MIIARLPERRMINRRCANTPLACGRITAVVGRNGRGKTTFLRCLTGLEKRDKSVLRFGDEAWDRKTRIKNVFLIAQDVNCQLFTQSVREEVEISLPEGRDARAVDEVLASLDLMDVAERPFPAYVKKSSEIPFKWKLALSLGMRLGMVKIIEVSFK